MPANFIQEGNTLAWSNTSGSPIPSGGLVAMGSLLGVAMTAIDKGEVGTVTINGAVFSMPKVTGRAWTQGASLLWDVSVSAFDLATETPESGDIVGAVFAASPAASGAVLGDVGFSAGIGTIT